MKVLYKPLSLLFSVLGGVLAGAVFSKLWGAMTGEDDAPSADSTDHSTSEVLVAAVLQGAIAGGVRAALNRARGKSIRSLSGTSSKNRRSH